MPFESDLDYSIGPLGSGPNTLNVGNPAGLAQAEINEVDVMFGWASPKHEVFRLDVAMDDA